MKIKIIVDRGMVQNVFADGHCEVEVIDLDTSESCERRKELENMVKKIEDSGAFQNIY